MRGTTDEVAKQRFARQRWRAWIETAAETAEGVIKPGSPASDGGRGLKRIHLPHPIHHAIGSPASDGGRGLKQKWNSYKLKSPAGSPASDGGRGLKPVEPDHHPRRAPGSPASDGGRGLKLALTGGTGALTPRFARQRWRAWIETSVILNRLGLSHWFARQRWRAWIET